MNNIFRTRVKTNLDGVLQMTQMIDGIMMTGDNAANEILVELYRGIDRVTIDPGIKIVGYFIRSDGYTLETDGEITANNEARVVIPEAAYQVSGNLSIAIRMFLGEHEATYRGYYIMRRGYYDMTSGQWVEEDDESVIVGPNGEQIVVENIFIEVTDPDQTVGPDGEEIVEKTFTTWDNKIVIATLNCFVQITETDSIIDVYHHIPDVQELLQYLDELDLLKTRLLNTDQVINDNELNRQLAETVRGRQETERDNAETARSTAEGERKIAEKSRSDREAERLQAESGRVTAESQRVQAESGRVTAESQRVQAESGRVAAESQRVTAESQRVQDHAARMTMIDGMTVGADELPVYSEPTVVISMVNGHKHIQFGLTPGAPFVIQKIFSSIAEMEAYTGTDIRVGQFVMITSNVQDPDNARMYVKTATGYSFVTDLSGSQGIQGPQGVKGDTGNGISSASLGSDYKLTLNFTNGSSFITPISIRGARGNGITNVSMNDYKLTFTFTDGDTYTTPISIRGEQGIQGIQGIQGETGNGIASVMLTEDYKLQITFTNGSVYTTDRSIRGPRGEDGGGSVALDYDDEALHLDVTIN